MQIYKWIALEFELTYVFASFGEIQPSTIVIDNRITIFTTITNFANKDIKYGW